MKSDALNRPTRLTRALTRATLALALSSSLPLPLAPLSALSAAPLPLPAWAPPDAAHALLMSIPQETLNEYKRPLTDALQRLDAMSATLDDPKLRALSEHLKAINWERGEWGGVDLTRGLALYVTDDARARVVVGVSDPAALQAQLKRHAEALGGAPSLEGMRLGHSVMRCGLTEGWWVCDSAPFSEGDAPEWAAHIPSNASLWARMGGGEQLRRLARALDLPAAGQAQAVTLSVVSDRDPHQRLTLTSLDVAIAHPALLALNAPAAPSQTLSAISPLSPINALLTLPMTTARPFAAQGIAGAPPELQPTLKLALEALNGEVQLSFGGSLLRPVLSLGLSAPRGGELIEAVVATATALGAPLSAREEGEITALRLSPSPKVNVTLKALSTPKAIHLALHSADLLRIARDEREGGQVSLLPAHAAGSLLALQIATTPRALIDGVTALNEVLELNLPGGEALNLSPLVSLFAHTYDSLIDGTVWLKATPGHVTLNALSRSLGGDL